MKEMTKAEKLLAKAVNACGENESLLIVYSGKDDGNVAFTGDPNEVAVGFAHILANGVVDGASKNERKLANSVLNGIYKVLCEGDETATAMIKAIDKVVHAAKEELAKRNAEKRNNINSHAAAPEEFNPNSEECLSCEEFTDCAIRFLRDVQKRLQSRTSKARNGGGSDNGNGTKKTKKKRNNGNRK